MDDQGFDDIIKRKVGEYEDPKFDTSSLFDFHNRMATLESVSWYSRYRTEIMIGSGILLSTLIILSGLWFMNQFQSRVLEKNKLYIQDQQKEIAKLKHEINYLKNLPPDTVHVIKFKGQPPSSDTYVLQRIADLESTILRMEELYKEKSWYPVSSDLADTSVSGDNFSEVYDLTFGGSPSSRLIPIESELKSLSAEPKPISNGNNNKAASAFFSVKTTRELEKHYRRGIGIRLGPVLELSKGFYSQGAGGIDITGGLLGDLILSPSISLETGGKFIHRFYEIGDDEISAMNSKLPYVNADLAPVTQVDIDSWMIEIPINLKYRYPLSPTSHALAGIGYSSLLYTKQVLEYSYNLDTVTSGYITEPHTISKYRWSIGTLNISLGLSKRLKNNKILETSLYYQHGLGESGVEKTKSNFLGIRGAYWFTIKR